MYAAFQVLNSPHNILQTNVFFQICSLGSARAVNHRYISDCVLLKTRMQASAGFVSASALGMACGPALAGLLQKNFKIYKLTFNQDTLPGWVMSIAWFIYLIWLCISFKEPSRDIEEKHVRQGVNAGILSSITFFSILCYVLMIHFFLSVNSLEYQVRHPILFSPEILQNTFS